VRACVYTFKAILVNEELTTLAAYLSSAKIGSVTQYGTTSGLIK